MTMVEEELKSLKDYLERIEKQFIAELLVDEFAEPEKCDLPVRAYCVLSHAAFEEYFEKVAIRVMDTSVEWWRTKGKATRPIILLIKCCPEIFKIDYEDDKDELKCFDYIKDYLDKSRKWFSNQVEYNNGISLKYLKKMFYPLSLTISNDANFRNSLSQLALLRGDFAHKKIAKRIPNPKDAKQFVSDVLDYSESLCTNSNALFEG